MLSRAGALTGSKMRDPYIVLGIAKTASLDEIKKAYRKLAKKFHPDQSKDPKAKDKFAEVSSAYEIIGDETKRGQFDRGEIDAEGKPKFQGLKVSALARGRADLLVVRRAADSSTLNFVAHRVAAAPEPEGSTRATFSANCSVRGAVAPVSRAGLCRAARM